MSFFGPDFDAGNDGEHAAQGIYENSTELDGLFDYRHGRRL